MSVPNFPPLGPVLVNNTLFSVGSSTTPTGPLPYIKPILNGSTLRFYSPDINIVLDTNGIGFFLSGGGGSPGPTGPASTVPGPTGPMGPSGGAIPFSARGDLLTFDGTSEVILPAVFGGSSLNNVLVTRSSVPSSGLQWTNQLNISSLLLTGSLNMNSNGPLTYASLNGIRTSLDKIQNPLSVTVGASEAHSVMYLVKFGGLVSVSYDAFTVTATVNGGQTIGFAIPPNFLPTTAVRGVCCSPGSTPSTIQIYPVDLDGTLLSVYLTDSSVIGDVYNVAGFSLSWATQNS
jgi:hypothetical protein